MVGAEHRRSEYRQLPTPPITNHQSPTTNNQPPRSEHPVRAVPAVHAVEHSRIESHLEVVLAWIGVEHVLDASCGEQRVEAHVIAQRHSSIELTVMKLEWRLDRFGLTDGRSGAGEDLDGPHPSAGLRPDAKVRWKRARERRVHLRTHAVAVQRNARHVDVPQSIQQLE